MSGEITLPAPGRAARLLRLLDAYAHRIALAAVLVSLLVAGGYAVHLGEALRYLDEEVYVRLAESVVAGLGYSADGVQPTAYRPPGYPFLLVPVHWVTGGSVLAMRFVGVLALAGCVWLAYRLGTRVSRPATGALAAACTAGYPLLVYTATTLYPQVPALLLLLAMLEFGPRALERTGACRICYLLLAGFAGGLLSITVPNFAPSVLIIVCWLALRHRRTALRFPAMRVAAGMLAVVAVLPAAWCVRNALALNAFVPVSTNDGINLLLGNSEHATPGSGTDVDISDHARRAEELGLDEVGINDYFKDSAIDWITEHPGDAAVLYLGKVANNFAFSSEVATSGQGGSAADLVLAATYYPVLALAVWRVLDARRRPLAAGEKLAAVLILLNVLLLAVFFTRLRFRVPLDGLTILLAASAVTSLLRGRARS
ncbi:ArnT family glycosyltransferase [Amycolatopsis cihanbeyliensis]|uniref:Dolichyl-phosphate-mannose-protein mannosyltransferase n=1 Tax=Amycolatopsis cihanbeyliensis TaxID=1128664 RepID=A0A542DFJ1_AMYCI|nr:glycosyltransferase family 39 protein [Amycolatopsis cihanbeyliensis]TQJ01836.1 dolichyl-phosphate-mannose-protein mannosyltransferase [Amycolatopsis cihanbeyliensis]